MKLNKLLVFVVFFISLSFSFANISENSNLESKTPSLGNSLDGSEQTKQIQESVEKLKIGEISEQTKKEWDQFSKNMNQEYDQLMARAEKILGKENFEKKTEQDDKSTNTIPSRVTNLENGVNSSTSEHQSEAGYRIEDVTTVGLLMNEKMRFKNCLTMKKYGGGAWQTYCQPLVKPSMCTAQDWRDISTMAIMYC
ncbi:hypothetical protein IB643_07445 [Allofrancisella guangzhouensis]|uniref:hypothetical protein n=1 Tax=Allofrancisella guangzhouensis TaxID=594679 RepID=UPI00068B57F6|nr:hypothetical protein [Allofrancisella guangzhouensis]MBK2027981.1 hypothetical protein [Allofrancisella guangzhouensis]MBK2045889.1 hypothetical protein [Allofrancisella guangzhouensis]